MPFNIVFVKNFRIEDGTVLPVTTKGHIEVKISKSEETTPTKTDD